MSRQQQPRLIRYRYDALDCLSSHCQLDNSDCQRFYCASHLVTEVQGDEHISIVQNGDQLLAQRRLHGGEVDSALIATDQQRSVLHALRARSMRSVAYAAYGHRDVDSGLSSLLGFNGLRPEPVTGHYLLGNGYRAFNPVLMRFNSPDNFSPFGKGGLNSYAYCQGDPINRSDPTGHFTPPPLSPLFSKFTAAPASIALGFKLQPVTNVTRLSEGIFAFEDIHKNGRRLTFQAHGSAGLLEEGLTAEGLFNLSIDKGINYERFENVRLVICESADAAQNTRGATNIPLGQAFYEYVKLPVKAYSGRVRSNIARADFEALEIGERYSDPYFFGIEKNNVVLGRDGERYSPVIFNETTLLAAGVRGK